MGGYYSKSAPGIVFLRDFLSCSVAGRGDGPGAAVEEAQLWGCLGKSCTAARGHSHPLNSSIFLSGASTFTQSIQTQPPMWF